MKSDCVNGSVPRLLSCLPAASAVLFSALTAGRTTHLVCFPVPQSLHASVFFLHVRTGQLSSRPPAPTYCFYFSPDYRETVIVSTSALNGSTGCFWSTQPVKGYLVFFFFFLISPLAAAVGPSPDLDLLALRVSILSAFVIVSVYLPMRMWVYEFIFLEE